MGGAEVGEAGFGGELQKFDRLRQEQHRRRGEQHAVRHRHDGADGAAVGRLLVIIPVRRLLLVGGQTRRILDYEVRSAKEVGLRCRGLESGSSLRRMEMAERQHNLDGEREQRQPGAKFDVFSNPLHEFAPTLGTAYPDCPDVTL
jgi:hypothetical protein